MSISGVAIRLPEACEIALAQDNAVQGAAAVHSS